MFLFSLSVHNLEFCPQESLRAVQEDSQLLFSHYLPCTGNGTIVDMFSSVRW